MNKKIKFWYFIDKHGDPWYCGLKPAWNDEIKDWETDPNDILGLLNLVIVNSY